LDKSGVVVKKKARLVMEGSHQEEGKDFDETFTPARLEAIRILHAFASHMSIKLF